MKHLVNTYPSLYRPSVHRDREDSVTLDLESIENSQNGWRMTRHSALHQATMMLDSRRLSRGTIDFLLLLLLDSLTHYISDKQPL